VLGCPVKSYVRRSAWLPAGAPGRSSAVTVATWAVPRAASAVQVSEGSKPARGTSTRPTATGSRAVSPCTVAVSVAALPPASAAPVMVRPCAEGVTVSTAPS
jgi:hypothetical protein